MGPENEVNPKPQADDKIAAVPSEQMWELTAKITVRADTAEEAEQLVDDILQQADVVDSFEYVD